MTLNPVLEPNWFNAILPETILAVAGVVLILLSVFIPRARGAFAPLTMIVLAVALWAEFGATYGVFLGGQYEVSPITRIFSLAFLLATLLAVMFSRDYLVRERLEDGEYYALLLWGTMGMLMMAKGLELLVVILGLETLSICIFVLVGYHRRVSLSNEASLKYFLMGAFATGFILYGTALFFGNTGTTNVREMAVAIQAMPSIPPILTIGFVMFIAGLGFKLALAPFHAWAPDVYQGSPTPIAAWLSTAPKAATLIALMNLLVGLVPIGHLMIWIPLLSVLAVASMIIGNLVATAQRDLKRMLAYSGIAHVGYMVIAVLAFQQESVAAVAFYSITYALMNIGAFGVVSLLNKSQAEAHTLNDIAGLGFRRPFYGFALALFMFSLAGLPPTAGFISKIWVFKVALQGGHLTVAIIGILTSIVSVYYYLRVVYYLYMKEGDETVPVLQASVLTTAALAIAMIGILLMGIYPMPIFDTLLNAATIYFQTP
jgi:NADH-quinone oxidoreductase subunit N